MSRRARWVELGEVCEFQVGLSVSSKDQFKKNIDDRLQPLIKIGNMQEAGISVDTLSWIDPSSFTKIEKFIVYPEEILIAKDATIGKIAKNNTNREFFFSQHIYKFKPNLEVINQKYLFYALLMKQKKLSELKTSGPIPALELSRVKRIKIPLPSLEVQERIAKWLDAFSSLERQLERQLERHKSQYRYYLEQLMRGRQRVNLGDVCDIVVGIPVLEKDIFKKKINNYLRPLIKIGDFENTGISTKNLNYINPDKFANACKFIARPDEILMAKDGCTVGKLALNDSGQELFFSSTICKLIPRELIQLRYFFFALQGKGNQINKCKTLGPIPHLEIKKLKKLDIPLPSLEKQKQIADWLDKFRELTNSITKGLPKEILLLKKQSQYYREKLIS